MPRHSSLLLFVKVCCDHWLASSVSAFDGIRLRLAVLGNDAANRLMEWPTLAFYFQADRICIYPFDRNENGISWPCGDRIFLAIVLGREATSLGSAIRPLSRPCDFHATVRCCLPHFCSALEWVWVCGLGFGCIELPSSDRAIRPEHPDGRDRHSDKQLCYASSHSIFFLSCVMSPLEAVCISAVTSVTAPFVGTLYGWSPTRKLINKTGLEHIMAAVRQWG
jgi:hypothetical protein